MFRAFCILTCLAAPAWCQEFFTLKGHGGPIMDIAVSPSGQIATASFDNSVGAWSDGVPFWFDGHEAAVTALAFMDDNAIISGGDDFTLRAWSQRDPDRPRIIGKHQAKITAIAISVKGDVATASWDATIGLWSPDGTVKFLKGHQQGVNDVAFNADGTRVYSASTDGTVRILSLIHI